MKADFKGLESWVEVFAAGEQTDSKGVKRTFTTADLDQMVANHTSPIPHVITHEEVYSPFAYAHGHRIKRDGNTLLVKSKKIDPAFARLLESGRLFERSVRIAKGANGWKVGHIAWLGAEPPAVEGLAPLKFSKDDNAMDFSHITKQEDVPMALTTEQQAAQDALIAKAKADAAADAKALAEADHKAATAQAAADHKAALAAKDAEIKQVADHKAAEGFKAVVDKAIAEGRLTPAQATGAAEFHAALTAETYDFSADDGKTMTKVSPRQWIAEFMASLPKQVAMADDATEGGDDAVDASDPEALAKSMAEYQAERLKAGVDVSSAEALKHVLGSGSGQS